MDPLENGQWAGWGGDFQIISHCRRYSGSVISCGWGGEYTANL